MDGLASGVVISRTLAEQAQSWKAVFDRAVEDWPLVPRGFGSVTAAFVSITFVSAVLHFGPAPQREDSVSASSAIGLAGQELEGGGSLYVWTTPVRTSDWRIMLTARSARRPRPKRPRACRRLSQA